MQQADAETLVTLLHLRDISRSGANRFSIVSEMLDVRNRELAEVTQADDFIVSDKPTSLLMAQVTENKDLRAVFDDLFDPEARRSISSRVRLRGDREADVVLAPSWSPRAAAAMVANGYRQVNNGNGKSDGVRVNPSR